MLRFRISYCFKPWWWVIATPRILQRPSLGTAVGRVDGCKNFSLILGTADGLDLIRLFFNRLTISKLKNCLLKSTDAVKTIKVIQSSV